MYSDRDALVVAMGRSPIGRAFKGSLASERPDDMAAQVIANVLQTIPQLPPAQIDDLLLGCGSPGGEHGFNMARVVSVLLGHDELPGVTLTRYCASSVQTTRMAMHAIRAGEGDVYISAGVESCSSYQKGEADSIPGTMNPLFDPAQERTKNSEIGEAHAWTDPRNVDELPDVYINMGQTAENVALHSNVSRHDMDAYAYRSQKRAADAQRDGFWDKEIIPYHLADGSIVSKDDSLRPSTTLEGLAELKPAFRPKGRVTAGNSCPLSDGAAALVIMSGRKARELDVQPLARIVATSVSGISPEIMGLGPIEATRRVLKQARMTITDIDFVELNEAFAAQVLPSQKALAIPDEKFNVNGGAIAIGHPFGATGARITATLINLMRDHDKSLGLETMCVGGGQGMAMILERLA